MAKPDQWWKSLPAEVWGQQSPPKTAAGGAGAVGQYTGAGPDGVVQPNKPAFVDQTSQGPVVGHEGEIKVEMPDGNVVMLPQNEVATLAQKYGWKGFEVGGSYAQHMTPKAPESARVGMEKAKSDPGAYARAMTPTQAVGGRAAKDAADAAMKNPVNGPSAAQTAQSVGALEKQKRIAAMKAGTTGLDPASQTGQATTASVERAKRIAAMKAGDPNALLDPAKQSAQAMSDRPVPGSRVIAPPPEETPPSAADGYTKTGMDIIKGVATGESPVYDTFWNRAVGEQAGAGAASAAALKQEAAQAGMTAEQSMSGQRSSARDVESARASLLGDLAESAGTMSLNAAGQLVSGGQTQQGIDQTQENIDFAKEQYADSQDWVAFDNAMAALDFRGAAAKFKGITGNDMDVGKLEEAHTWKQKDQAYKEASIKVEAGDYTGVNGVLEAAGITPIDFSKVEAGELRGIVSDIDGVIAGLGADADPGLLSFLGAVKMNVMEKGWDAYGVDPDKMTFTDPATGEEMSADDLLSVVEDPEAATPSARNALVNLDGAIELWWNESDKGSMVRAGLESTDAGANLLADVDAGEEGAAEELGAVISASFTQSRAEKLTDNQIELLKKFDLYDETASVNVDDVEPLDAKNAAKTQIIEGNYEYADLSDEVKAIVTEDDFNKLATAAIVDKLSGGNIVSPDGKVLLTDKELDLLYSSGNSKYVTKDISSIDIPSLTKWTTSGKNRWKLKEDVVSWANANTGKMFEGPNGTRYVLEEFKNPKDRRSRGSITVRDINTGVVTKISSSGDWPKE